MKGDEDISQVQPFDTIPGRLLDRGQVVRCWKCRGRQGWTVKFNGDVRHACGAIQ